MTKKNSSGTSISAGTHDTLTAGGGPVPRHELRREVRRLLVDGVPVQLGGRAFDLLVALADRAGRVTHKDELLQAVWPGKVVEENRLQVLISALRKLLGADAIRTVSGRGYLLDLPFERRAAPRPPGLSMGALGAPGAARPAAAPSSRLPHDLPPLIGRDPELLALQALLAQHRVVTVVGPGGVGKTRLALAAATQAQAQQQADAGGRPVHLIELAGMAEGAPVAEAVARALGIGLPGLRAAPAELVDVLETRDLLLVLDNCEHRLKEVGELVDALARHAPRARVLATSQQPLACRSEQLLRLASLAVPREGATLAEALACGSVALLIERVHSRDPTFAVDAGNAADAVAICQRLDGLPLAIELAAARVPLLGLAGLRQRLGEHLRVLAAGPGRERELRPQRQRTLRAAIEWSHALLNADERRVFRRLGVFSGSFSLAAAEAVAPDPADVDTDTMDTLHALVDRSLLLRVSDGDPSPVLQASGGARLRLLDSTRAFALEQLHAAGENERVMQRLCAVLLPVFELSAEQRAQPTAGDMAQTRAADIGNLRAALDWLGSQPAMALQHVELAGAVAWIWPRVGLRLEGFRRCRDALERVDATTPTALEARLQLGYARQAFRRATTADCAAAERAAVLYAQLDDRLARFMAFSSLAHMRALRGEEAPAMAALEAMADAFDPDGSPIQWGTHLFTTGHALGQFGRLEEALAMGQQARQVAAELPGNMSAQALLGLANAQLHALDGRFDVALEHAQRGLDAARRLGASGRIGMLLGDMATYLIELNRPGEALARAREAVDVRAKDGTLWLQLDQLAQLASARGRLREAALALGRAEVHNAWRPGRREAAVLRPFELASAAVREAFTADELKALYAQGAAMGDVEVARLTLDGPATADAPVPLLA